MKKWIFSLIFLSLLISGCGTKENGGSEPINVSYEKEDYKKILSANNQLGMDLISELDRDEAGNIFISPMSLMMALSMLYNGADGATKDEIAQVLHTNKMDVKELNEANASLLAKLNKETDLIELNIANSMWIDKKYEFQTDFAETNKGYLNAEIQEIESADIINNWVKKATNNKIEEMVEDPLNPDLAAILLNAIYFKGEWKYEFEKNETKDGDFTLNNGETKKVPFMKMKEKLAYMENNDFQAVSLPYGDGEMSMKVFLPNENTSMGEFEQMLSTKNWEKWNSEFSESEGTVVLPKFELEYEANLNEALQNLGMPSAFSSEADLSKVIKNDGDFAVSDIKQKTFIEVNEKGTEAAAATSVEIVKMSLVEQPFYMDVNRPFFMAITDDETGMILFMGSIAHL
ncbi:serpin family protein [Cytobacillus purgationiresistens]|uniref:Serpin B n=1 Tax=Cytobacillus purgationiresistens TaxID=863449 RepID=A0ABU0AJF6_9BACI|nr:serpin family protein [Cytobacillus purgationiresistens]MDQ0271393.1 serpin B [Cytobacillus purgationiresistens]